MSEARARSTDRSIGSSPRTTQQGAAGSALRSDGRRLPHHHSAHALATAASSQALAASQSLLYATVIARAQRLQTSTSRIADRAFGRQRKRRHNDAAARQGTKPARVARLARTRCARGGVRLQRVSARHAAQDAATAAWARAARVLARNVRTRDGGHELAPRTGCCAAMHAVHSLRRTHSSAVRHGRHAPCTVRRSAQCNATTTRTHVPERERAH